jgi:tetratricopeptide (TPR) repeat protein
VIGVGDPANGGRIPVPADTSDGGDSTRYLTYRGETVVTKPDPDRLRRIATGFGGRLDWLRSASDIPDLLATLDASVDEAAETQLRRAAPPRFQWFLAAALVLVVIELFRGDRASGDRWTELPTDKTAERLTRRRATLGALLLFVSGSCAPDESFGFVAVDSSITGMTERQIAERYNLGVSAYRAGRLDEAGDHFSRVVEAGWGELRRHALFNLANTFAASREHGPIPKTDAIRRLRRAIALYRRCIATGVRPEDARANLEIVYRRLQRIRRLDPETRQRDSGPPEQEPSSGRDESERGRGGHANATRRPRRGEAGGDRSGNSPTAKPGDPPPDRGRAETSGNEPRSERGATETRPLTDEQAERLLQRIHRRAADAGRTGSGRGDDTPEGGAPGLRPW